MVEIFGFYLEYDNYSDKFNYKKRGRVTIIQYYSYFVPFFVVISFIFRCRSPPSYQFKKFKLIGGYETGQASKKKKI